MSGPRGDAEPDAAVGQRLLGDGVALLAGLQAGLLDRVGLQEAVELRLFATSAFKAVEVDGARRGVDDGGVLPAGQVQQQASRLAAEELRGAPDRGGQAEAL